MFEKYNKMNTMPDIDTDGFEYHALKEYEGKILRPCGFLIHSKSKYGKSLALCMDDGFINMPSFAVETFESFGDEEIQAVLDGNLVITDIRPIKTQNGPSTGYRLADYDSKLHKKCRRSVE